MTNMCRKRLVRTMIVSVLIALMFITMTTPHAMSASGSTKKMTVYDQVIKKGKYAYCSAYHGIYKVNLKTGSKKRLVKFNDSYGNYDCYAEYMVLRKGYIYYIDRWVINGSLYRVKTSGKAKKYLGQVSAYAIKDNKLYYTKWINNGEKLLKKRMNLKGKNKKSSSFKVKNKIKKSNAKGYYVKSVLKDSESYYDYEIDAITVTDYYTDYLVRPSGMRIKLCDYKMEHVK